MTAYTDAQLEAAFAQLEADPRFRHGRYPGPPSGEMGWKRFTVEVYLRMSKQNGIAFGMGLPSTDPDRITVWSVGENGEEDVYHGTFVRHFENGGVVVRDDVLGCVCLPSGARWKYEAQS